MIKIIVGVLESTFSYDIFISNDDSIQILDNIYRKIKIGFNLEATVQDFSYFEVWSYVCEMRMIQKYLEINVVYVHEN